MSDSSSEEITLDEQGRCIIGGSVDLTTRCFEHALPVVSDSLLADAAAAFTARAAGVGELSAGCTFWVPAATKKPKTSLEQLALDIFTFHARDAVFEPSKSGAEWWTLVIDESDELPKSIAKQLSVAASGVRMGLGEAVPVPPQPVCSTLGDALPPLASWTFGEPRAKLTLSMPWPHAAVATLVDASRMATKGTRSAPPFLSITFGDGSGAELAPAQKLMKSEKKRMQKDGAADAERAARHDARHKRPKSKG
ncbi:hypothetical protein Ctob_013950 [Chrysochromulina tobinii]|uniref:Uncharacterized protein n=1 Tax=Chrysochromulina tobinii TaxID=1460289 RepID=A0A0M0K3F2_9EUKA|nr:hypothetical protein Ctob_013950 [Chrysochromulina tobinii]|eukprot:KOO33345.1 hypothetical protein Ctob_013950 [Chrysochromulina sp. CCMP291]